MAEEKWSKSVSPHASHAITFEPDAIGVVPVTVQVLRDLLREAGYQPPDGPTCSCFYTPESMWTTHYGAVEPGSQMELNPECLVHFPDGVQYLDETKP